MKLPGTMLRIDSLREPRDRVKPIPSGRYYQGRTHSSATRFGLSGSKNGSQAPKALTYGRSTAPYRRDTPESFTEIYSGTTRTYLLTQLRTGHNWLSSYRKKIGYSEDDRCECGAQETVAHVLLDYPRLRELWAELRRKVRDTLGSVFNSVVILEKKI